jgi:site-specific recombinase XerD
MDPAAPTSLLRSFERHLRAENRSDQTVATYLIGARQAEAFLADRGTSVAAASRADLEAFLGDPLAGRTASTAATYYKVLRILYRWLEEEDEITANPHGQDAAADRARPAGPGRPRRRAAAVVRRLRR